MERESADGGGNCNLAPLKQVGFCPSFLSMLFCQGMERDQSYLWCGLSKSSQVRNRSDFFGHWTSFFLGNGGFLPFLIGIASVREVVYPEDFDELLFGAKFFHRFCFVGPGMKGQSCRILSRWCAQQPTEYLHCFQGDSDK